MDKGFAPIVKDNAIILIIGSFPGIESLLKKQYYGNNRNQFWKIIGDIFSYPNLNDADYDIKIRALTDNMVALWDAIDKCERIGSLDSKINMKSASFNDINKLLLAHPSINKVFSNGKKASALLSMLNIDHIVLPSTSPANTVSYETKLNVWKEIIINK